MKIGQMCTFFTEKNEADSASTSDIPVREANAEIKFEHKRAFSATIELLDGLWLNLPASSTLKL